jgi:hypothetical protein
VNITPVESMATIDVLLMGWWWPSVESVQKISSSPGYEEHTNNICRPPAVAHIPYGTERALEDWAHWPSSLVIQPYSNHIYETDSCQPTEYTDCDA